MATSHKTNTGAHRVVAENRVRQQFVKHLRLRGMSAADARREAHRWFDVNGEAQKVDAELIQDSRAKKVG